MTTAVLPSAAASDPLTLGIDIGKATLDIHILPIRKHMRVANTDEGHQTLIASLEGRPVRACVFEATGHHGRKLHQALHEAGLPVIQVNPRQASFFLKSHSPSHKTDKSDAAALAAMANAMPLRVTPPPSPEQQALRELVSARTDLVRDRVAMRERLETMTQPLVRTSLESLLQTLEEEIASLEQAARDLIEADPAIKAKAGLIMSVPGIGWQCACALLAFLPELGSVTGKQIASLAGVAPRACDSGMFKGKRSIRGGRTELRTTLYMGAMAAMRFNPAIRQWLQGNNMPGKPHKTARIATVRKLLVILNAMVKKNVPWQYKTVD